MFSAVGLKTHIWNNNIRSVLLLMGFPLLLILMMWGFYALTTLFSAVPPLGVSRGYFAAEQGFLWVGKYWYWGIIVALVWFLIAFFFHQRMINKAVHSHSVSRKEEPGLYNLLENLCISRGMPMPKLCIIETEALNAFASGINKKTYTVTVTRGLLERLNEQELRAVLAHELTHILNSDVRLLIISVIFVGMISFFAEMAAREMFWSSMSRRNTNSRNNGLAVVAAFIILMVGYVFAILIRFALSRKREFLADAGAVELTKNPDAMVSALRKISGNDNIPDVADEVRGMFIENSSTFLGLFATHPPIGKRIAALQKYAGAHKS
jgi:heat shock protein HtpX